MLKQIVPIFLTVVSFSSMTLAQETMRVNEDNVPQVLQKMASSIEAGMEVNEYTIIDKVVVTDKVFTIFYQLSVDGNNLQPEQFETEEMAQDILEEERGICAIKTQKTLMEYGLRLYVYTRT